MNAPSLRIVVVMLVFAGGIARAASFTFADNNGAPYCDSIRITKSGGLVGGVIDSEACKPAGKTIGAGVESRLPGEPTKRVSFGYSLKKYAVLFLLDTQALTWAMYVSSGAGRMRGRAARVCCAVWRSEGRKGFFFEKKKQKTFTHGGRRICSVVD